MYFSRVTFGFDFRSWFCSSRFTNLSCVFHLLQGVPCISAVVSWDWPLWLPVCFQHVFQQDCIRIQFHNLSCFSFFKILLQSVAYNNSFVHLNTNKLWYITDKWIFPLNKHCGLFHEIRKCLIEYSYASDRKIEICNL